MSTRNFWSTSDASMMMKHYQEQANTVPDVSILYIKNVIAKMMMISKVIIIIINV